MTLAAPLLRSAFDFVFRDGDYAFREIRQSLHRRLTGDSDLDWAHRWRFLPRRSCGAASSARLRQFLAGQHGIGEALAEDRRARLEKPHAIGQFATVEAIHLLIQIPEQVKRFNGHLGALQCTFHE